jgi:hypothetical protein
MEREEKQRMWDNLAESLHTPEGIFMSRAFTASMTKPLLKKVENYSITRKLSKVVRPAKPGDMIKFQPVQDKPVWLLPGLGYMAQEYSCGSLSDKFTVPLFDIAVSREWKLTSDIEVIENGMDNVAKAIAWYEHEALMRTLVAVATCNPVINCLDKKFSKLEEYLIKSMKIAFEKCDKELGYILAPNNTPLGEVDDVAIIFMEGLGHEGLWNINGESSETGCFKASSGSFNNYTLTYPNLNNYSEDAKPSVKGEYQIYGLSKDITEHLLLAITRDFECFDDPTLIRKHMFGFFGWQKMGIALRDSDCVVMATVNAF